MNSLRAWLRSSGGTTVVVVGALVAVGVAVRVILVTFGFFGGSMPNDAHSTMYICTETGKTFNHTNKLGESHPIASPHSGKNTGVIAEACFWTADGQTKDDPTWVLLNELVPGKSGPTFCPDCGRLVVGHNPRPTDASKPPPTQEEYAAKRAARRPADPRDER